MNKLILFPILISGIVVLITFLMKKDEPDQTKKPNYAVLFLITLVVSGLGTYAFGNNEDGVNIVMKEIYTGEPNF